MASVTQRIKSIQQPHGGYLPMKSFTKEVLDDGIVLHEEENIHSSLVGIAVDYLTRFMSGDSVEQAFHISTLGAKVIGMQSAASALKATITDLGDKSIVSACKLAGFDVCYRSSVAGYKPVEEINPDFPTIENIRTMVNRSLAFWKKYGPVVNSEPTFEGGYSAAVNAGDGDYVTKDTLWDFKVSKTSPTAKHTLQILMYYVMGLHSVHSYFKDLKHLGFFNPRLNTVYICNISAIAKETIEEIENNVICYNASPEITKLKTPTSISKRQSAPSEVYYSVADICGVTGQKKSAVYADIRSGKLSSLKKGNKYVVTEYEFNRYTDYVKTQQKIAIIAALVFGVVAFVFILIMFGNLF